VTAHAGRTELRRSAATDSGRPRLAPFVQSALLAGPLLSMIDSSIVNVAVEPIARQLQVSLTTVQWTVSGYLLALGAGLAGTAYLARRSGTLPVYRTSVIAFTIASAMCALAAGLAMAPQGLITGLSTTLAPRFLAGFTVRITVLCGFAVLAAASLGLLLVVATTPLWLIAVILACRSVSIGLVINPLLQALIQPLRPEQLGDANTLFTTWQRIAGSFGIGLLAALYTAQARAAHGPVSALHLVGAVLAVIAVCGALAALALPAVRNTALKSP
jgi:MFS family permease